MIKPLLSAATFLAVTAIGRADWVIDSNVETAQGKMSIITKLQDERARLDMSGSQGEISTIVDSKSGDSTQLIHGQKMATTVPGAIVKQRIEQMKQAAGAGPTSEPAKASGEKEKVGAWDCEIYTWSSGATSMKLWVASNVPNGDGLKAAMGKLRSGAFGKTQVGPDESLLPGPVVRSETTAGGQTTKMTVSALKEEKLDASIFKTPADYKTTALPVSGAAPAKPAK